MILAIKRKIKEKIRNIFAQLMEEEGKNIRRFLQYKALESTTEYVINKLMHVQSVETRLDVHIEAIKRITIPPNKGVVVELGVYKGESINFIANLLKNYDVYGFDSFEGLPEDWRDGFPKGAFKLNKLPKVMQNVRLIKGYFDKTLPKFLEQEKRDIAYLHVDCDLYSSTKLALDILKDRIKAGTVIVFDEYFNYPGWQFGEFKAFEEFVEENFLKYEYITYCYKDQQVAVLIKA